MTSSNRFDQLIDAWEPKLRQAFLDAAHAMRGRADIAQIMVMLERRDIEGALRAVELDPVSFRLLDKGMANAFETGALATETIIPAVRGADGFRTVFQFNIRNPSAENWLWTYSSTLVREILDDQRTMIRDYLRAGLAQGANPRTTALDLVGRINKATGRREGGMIGLTSTQEQWLRNYEAELSSENPLPALNRKLRDARFDAAVRKAAESGEPIPAALKDKMLTAYRNRALRLRAEIIARSETITSLHAAQDQAIEQAIASGAIDRETVRFKWRASPDGPKPRGRVRDAHWNLNGKTAKHGEAFQSDLGPIRFPGDPNAVPANRINCRCWREPDLDFLSGIGPRKRKDKTYNELNNEAKDYVLAKGRADGKEHLAGFDLKTLKKLANVDSARGDLVGITSEIRKLIRDRANRVTLHHNHPMNSSLSLQDMRMMASFPGIAELYAHGHDGSSYLAKAVKDISFERFERVAGAVRREMQQFVRTGRISIADANRTYLHIVNSVWSSDGSFLYEATLSGETLKSYNRNKDVYDRIIRSFGEK